MARNRMIKPEFWEDDRICSLSFQTRLFYIALWNFADDEGYLEERESWLKAKCFPYDDANIRRMIDELSSIDRVDSSNGVLRIKNFSKHQRIDRPRISGLKQQFDEPSTNDRRTLDEPSTTKYNIKENKINIKEDEVNTATAEAMQIFDLMGFENKNLLKHIDSLISDHGVKIIKSVALKVSGKFTGGDEGSRWLNFVKWCNTELSPIKKQEGRGITITN